MRSKLEETINNISFFKKEDIVSELLRCIEDRKYFVDTAVSRGPEDDYRLSDVVYEIVKNFNILPQELEEIKREKNQKHQEDKERENNDIVDVRVEVPYQSHIKYEWDEKLNSPVVDRILFSSVHYPGNYGYIPGTLSGDGDALDILVLNETPLMPGCLVKCKIIGCLLTHDEKGQDEKMLAVPLEKIDASCKDVNNYTDLGEYKLKKIRQFFEIYKELEPGKKVVVDDYVDKDKAMAILLKSLK